MPLDAEHEDLIRGLFASATGILEDAHEAAAEGQAPDRGRQDYQVRAAKLEQAAEKLKRLARGLEVLIARGGE
jgi:hypothetical protein